MKKTAIALAMATVLGVAGTAMAANPFTDVPANHWSYASVSKLAQAGIIEGYGDGTFRGNNSITRYEMAQMVAKAMARSDKADAAQKAMIEKLAAEYSAELNNLGVRVSALEKKTDNVKITGAVRARYRNTDYDVAQNKKDFQLRTRLAFQGTINEDWKYNMVLEDNQDMFDGNSNQDQKDGSTGNTYVNRGYVEGPLFGANVKAGRIYYMPVYGMFAESYYDGVEATFGNKLKTTLRYGREDNSADSKLTYTGVELGYATSNATNLKAAYHNVDSDHAALTVKDYYEVGFDSRIAKNVTMVGMYLDSDASAEDQAWMAKFMYKGANKAKPHSWGAFVDYRDAEANATFDSTFDLIDGYKGFEVGFDYTLAKNIVLTTTFVDGEKNSGTADDAQFFQSYLTFTF